MSVGKRGGAREGAGRKPKRNSDERMRIAALCDAAALRDQGATKAKVTQRVTSDLLRQRHNQVGRAITEAFVRRCWRESKAFVATKTVQP